MLALLRPRCKKLTDYADQLAPFFVDPASYDADSVKKHLGAPEMPGHLTALREAYAALPEWSEAALEQSLRALAEARGVKAGALIHGTRLAMTGRMVSPGLFEMLVPLGRDPVLGRLDRLIRESVTVAHPPGGDDPFPSSVRSRYNRWFQPTGRSFNGRTADSDSAYRGSNPCLPANSFRLIQGTVTPNTASGYAF